MLDIKKITSKEQFQVVYVTKENADEFMSTLKYPNKQWLNKQKDNNSCTYQYFFFEYRTFYNHWYVYDYENGWEPFTEEDFTNEYEFVKE